MEDTLQDRDIFLLNNILMSVQFFENYERDIKLLRENWFKEVLLESHHKKCFHADSLFRLSGANVKFSPRHGMNEDLGTPLHPFRIYITSDNIEAAYDPSALGRNKLNVWPQYQFTVKVNEKNEKSGYISLVEFKTVESPNKNPRDKTPQNNLSFNEITETNSSSSNLQRKSVFEKFNERPTTTTEKLIGLHSKELNLKILDRRTSLKHFTTAFEGIIPVNGFYKFQNREARLRPESIQEFRMKSSPDTSHEIPLECFQREEKKGGLNSRKNELNGCFRSQKILNSAAFKGYFCDLLIERLSGSLSLDFEDINESFVLEEFIVVYQKRVQYNIAPVITIRDWKDFVTINTKFQNSGRAGKLKWPSDQMQKIINVLPCNAAPIGQTNDSEENLNFEKTWKLIFPKAEEFLLLHMMHAHIRCYFFALIIYKSFIETEINGASFGPKQLLHLLFWRVHKDFLAWPEDRPGETLLTYLKALYKKLQNKSLCDFFITSRNLFASSLPKDLHRAQALIKKIIENPVPYVIRAIRNLHFKTNFYPAFDVLVLNKVLTTVGSLEKSKKVKKQKMVRFQDEQQQWIKKDVKQIEPQRKAEEERIRKVSSESLNTEKLSDFSQDIEKCHQILKMFTSHFVNMASKSIEFKFYSQALLYLHQTQKLFEIVPNELNLFFTLVTEKIHNLRETCYNKLKQDFKKMIPKEQPRIVEKTTENYKNLQNETEEQRKIKNAVTMHNINEKQKETYNSENKNTENEIFSVKL